MKLKKNERGITLIALVITIIVLLILAGVTIVALSGPNGILTNATTAKIATEKAEVEEQIKLAVLGARTNKDNTINLEDLEENLNNMGEGVSITKLGEDGNLPWKVTYKGYKYKIDEEGNIEEVNGISLNKTSIKMVQGQKETITATLTEGVSGEITWESSNPSLVSVTNGEIEVIGTSGEATIIAKVSGTRYSAECTVTVVSKVTGITVNNLEVAVGETSQLEVTTTPSSNVEELVYESNKEDIAKVDSTGKVTGIAEGTATITVSGKISTGVKGTCQVTVIKPEGAPIGDYVEYNVTYTDMYTDYNFTATDGWRILDGGIPNGDGTYSGVKLISTGVPAKLYYQSKTATDGSTIGETNKPAWWGTEEQVRVLYGDTYANKGYIASGYPNYFAAAGLFKNFATIPFKTSGTYNEGSYKNINGKTSGELTGAEFIATGASEVHNLTLEELNTARGLPESDTANTATRDGDTGLFYLNGLQNENAKFGYYSSKLPYYWLADSDIHSTYNLSCVYNDGDIINRNTEEYGVRPVVSLESKIYKDGNLWEIQN